jgi:integrase
MGKIFKWGYCPGGHRHRVTRPGKCKCGAGAYALSESYHVSYRDTAGRERIETVGSDRTLAATVLKQREGAISEGRTGVLRIAQHPWSAGIRAYMEFLDLQLAQGEISELTYKAYESAIRVHLTPFFKDHTLNGITLNDINQFVASKVGLKNVTIRGYVAVMSAMMNYLESCEMVNDNPFSKRHTRKRISIGQAEVRSRILTAEEVHSVLEICIKVGAKPYLFAALAAYTGLRREDIITLEWSEIDLAIGFIRRKKIAKRRGKVPSPKPILPPLKEAIEAYRAQAVLSKYVFPKRGDRNKPVPANGHNPFVGLRDLLAKAGIAHFTAHDLRRTFASTCVHLGIPQAVVSDLLDHAPANVTAKHYIRTPEEILTRLFSGLVLYPPLLHRLAKAE